MKKARFGRSIPRTLSRSSVAPTVIPAVDAVPRSVLSQ
jgi:hypothetical protein